MIRIAGRARRVLHVEQDRRDQRAKANRQRHSAADHQGHALNARGLHHGRVEQPGDRARQQEQRERQTEAPEDRARRQRRRRKAGIAHARQRLERIEVAIRARGNHLRFRDELARKTCRRNGSRPHDEEAQRHRRQQKPAPAGEVFRQQPRARQKRQRRQHHHHLDAVGELARLRDGFGILHARQAHQVDHRDRRQETQAAHQHEDADGQEHVIEVGEEAQVLRIEHAIGIIARLEKSFEALCAFVAYRASLNGCAYVSPVEHPKSPTRSCCLCRRRLQPRSSSLCVRSFRRHLRTHTALVRRTARSCPLNQWPR